MQILKEQIIRWLQENDTQTRWEVLPEAYTRRANEIINLISEWWVRKKQQANPFPVVEVAMREPTQEQIKRLWEWCGLVKIDNPIPPEAVNSCEAMTFDRPVNGWYKPDYQNGTSELISLKDTPSIDLNNLFEYAVPVLIAKGYHIETRTYAREIGGILGRCSWVNITKYGELVACYHSPNLKDALLWAIYKVTGLEGCVKDA